MVAALIWIAMTGMGGGAYPAAQATSPPPSTMEMNIVAARLTGADGKIYVNEDCEVFPGFTLSSAGKKKPKGEWAPGICHLESVNDSQHREETSLSGKAGHNEVEVHEQEYVLQNITLKPQIFAVLQQVPQGWSVDSDPQPVKMDGDVAIFEVHADAGETVRLHVGMRHTRGRK
jgi:hypothetical protein